MSLWDEFVRDYQEIKAEWATADGDGRLAILQRYEDAMAERCGRWSYKIVRMSEALSKEIEGGAGYKSHEIMMNSKYFKKGSMVSSDYSFEDALATLTHEGRHAWQHYALDNPELGLLDEETYLALMMNRVGYVQDAIPYTVQLNEIDARIYALFAMQDLADAVARVHGYEDEELADLLEKEISKEAYIAEAFAYNRDYMPIVVAAEEATVETLEKLGHAEDFEGISHYGIYYSLFATKDIAGYLTTLPIHFRDELPFNDQIKVKIAAVAGFTDASEQDKVDINFM